MDREAWVSSRQYNWAARNEGILQRLSVLCLSIWLSDPWSNEPLQKKWELPQDCHSGRKKKHQPEGELISLKEITHMSTNLLEHLTGWIDTHIMMSIQWWIQLHLDWFSLDVYVLALYLNIDITSEPRRSISFSFFSMWSLWIHLFLFCTMNMVPLTGLLKMDGQMCLETQVVTPKSVHSNSLGPAGHIHLSFFFWGGSEDYERNRQQTTDRVRRTSNTYRDQPHVYFS